MSKVTNHTEKIAQCSNTRAHKRTQISVSDLESSSHLQGVELHKLMDELPRLFFPSSSPFLARLFTIKLPGAEHSLHLSDSFFFLFFMVLSVRLLIYSRKCYMLQAENKHSMWLIILYLF